VVTLYYFCDAAAMGRAAELQRWIEGAKPKFVLPDSAGTAVALEAGRGHVVVVHFFATWCEPRREELPALNRLLARANRSLGVLGIDVADADQRVQRFSEGVRVDFPVLLDRDRAVAKAWQVAVLPSTFVLDGDLQPCLAVQADYAWDGIDPNTLTNLCADETAATKNVSNR
jgi:thiol-disulfide isomerase/thioredoxin